MSTEYNVLGGDKFQMPVHQSIFFIKQVLIMRYDIINRQARKEVKDADKFNFSIYISNLISSLKSNGRDRTAETYAAMKNSFMRYRNNKEIDITALDATTIESYEAFLYESGLISNSTSFYLRTLRAAYYHAMDDAELPRSDIFRRVYTGICRTAKRALDANSIGRIKNVDLTDNPPADFARDMFMFSFYTRGMSFVDMAYLRKSDLREGVLKYIRRKTGKTLYIKWEKPMQKIVDKYVDMSSPYLLPILRLSSTSERSQYRGCHTKINRLLKTVARLADINSNLTTYVARHSWASIAKAKSVPVAIISEAMGHESERMTHIYLASLDTTAIDSANRLVFNSI